VFVFLASAVFRWPLLPVVAVTVPLSIGYAYWEARRAYAG
jgi:hypothetical protein